jgi:hypothetical protein
MKNAIINQPIMTKCRLFLVLFMALLSITLSKKRTSIDILDSRPVGPSCLDPLLKWSGKPHKRRNHIDKSSGIQDVTALHSEEGGLESLIDKIYVIHYSRAEDRKVKMLETLASVGVPENSSLVDFVEQFDREELPHDLGNCVQCGEKEISPAVCSVNLKHIAAYHDIVKQVSLYSYICVCVYAFSFSFFILFAMHRVTNCP